MVQRIFLIGMLIAACVFISAGTLGCAPQVTPIGTPAELKIARAQDLENWKKAQAAGVTVHDGDLQELEDRFQAKLLPANGPAEAVEDLTLYRTNKTDLPENELLGLEEYAETLDNRLSINSPTTPDQRVFEGSVISSDE